MILSIVVIVVLILVLSIILVLYKAGVIEEEKCEAYGTVFIYAVLLFTLWWFR